MGVNTYFQYSSFVHDPGEVVLTAYEIVPRYTERGHRRSAIYRMHISGELIGEGQALLTKIANLIDAYSVDGGDAVLYYIDGTATRHALYNNVPANLSGVHVSYRSWPRGDAAELATTRTFHIRLEAEYAEETSQILWFQESIRHIGTTGPRWVMIPQYSGPPIQQLICASTPQMILQSGAVVGFEGYPLGNVPPPFLPGYEHQDERVVEMLSPTWRGRKYTDFPIRWAYKFESPIQQNLIPTFG